MNSTVSDAERLERWDVVRVLAANSGPLTMSGTNSWVVGRDPAWVVDPGPALAEHLDKLAGELEQRGGLGGIALTHDHIDHSEGVAALRERFPAPLAAARLREGTLNGLAAGWPADSGHATGGPEDSEPTAGGPADFELRDGLRVGPFQALYTPGHAIDHFALLAGGACFVGDAVLGEGSVFVAPDPGALAGYLKGLERLRERDLDVLCPGHGPPIWNPRERLTEYIEHRLDRERRLVAALDEGRRTTAELLDRAWSDVPAQLRPLATITLAAHLDKLGEEGRLPDGVERASC